MDLMLYELAGARSARVRWTLLELDLPFESQEGFQVFRSDGLQQAHPLRKVSALVIDGRPLFESAAICTYLADSQPERGLIAQPGSWQRALHDQWVAFTLAELEAHLWSTTRNGFLYPEERRLPAIIEQNNQEATRSLQVLDDYLADKSYLIDDRFSVTDIFVGFAVNWARVAGLTEALPQVSAYNERLLARPLCPLRKD